MDKRNQILFFVFAIFLVSFMLYQYVATEDAPEKRWGDYGCESNIEPIFSHHVTDISKLNAVIPPPSLVQGDLKAHSYLDTRKHRVPVYAPVDMLFVDGTFYKTSQGGEYMLDFEVSCEVSIRFDHILEPVESIKHMLPSIPMDDSRTHGVSVPVQFSAGDLIAYTTGTENGIWDFGVYNTEHPNQFSKLDEYRHSKIYTTGDCPYVYFSDELKWEYEGIYDQHRSDPFDEFCPGAPSEPKY